MTGIEFEEFCAQLLSDIGFSHVSLTKSSGDQGVDITACYGPARYAIQCKCYSSNLGNTPVQEVFAGKEMYNCEVAAVLTNQHFTAGAVQLANRTHVLLWDRDWLQHAMASRICEKPLSSSASATENPFSAELEGDEMLPAAVDIILETGQASVSMLQRRLKLNYARAARIVDEMEAKGIVGSFHGSKPRAILVTKESWAAMKSNM